ncbi:MAG TPA: STAS domain-containing protein [Opitutus sp.]|nr:STAS domain-containing protein [Opitutus sp.]
MQIEFSTQGGWTVVSLAGPVDHAGAEQLSKALLPLMTGGAVALDFTGVDYVTSAGFRTLMQAEREQRAKKGKLVLGNLSDDVRRFFDIAGLSAVFKIASDLGAVTSEAP